MGMWSTITVHVETADAELLDKINALEELQINWNFRTKKPTILEVVGELQDYDVDEMMEHIGRLLNHKGMAYIIEDSHEDIPECTTTYYLGDEIKSVHFTCEDDYYGNEEGVSIAYYRAKQFSQYVRNMADEELLYLYSENYQVNLHDTRKEVIELISEHYENLLQECDFRVEWFSNDLKPFEKRALGSLLPAKTANYEDKDFVPNIGWVNKGIAKFTPIELEYLKGNFSVELTEIATKTMQKGKKHANTVSQMIERLMSVDDFSFDGKTVTIGNMADDEKLSSLITAIQEDGGIISEDFSDDTDCLVIYDNDDKKGQKSSDEDSDENEYDDYDEFDDEDEEDRSFLFAALQKRFEGKDCVIMTDRAAKGILKK